MKMKNLLEKIYKVVVELTDAPDTYIVAMAYHVISSTLGKYLVCPLYPKSPDNPMRPNLWVMISGIPGIMRKSTIINFDQYLIKTSWKEYYRQANPRLSEETINEIINAMFIEYGSPEGIADHIARYQNDLDIFILTSHEFGGIIKQLNNREYMLGLSSMLSKLWEGEETIWRGAKKDRFIRKGLYVTAIWGMQKPWLYLDNIVFQQGLMRRVLLIYARPEDKKRWIPPLSLKRSVLVNQLEDVSAEIGNKMYEISKYQPVMVDFTREALEKINNKARETEQNIIKEGETNWAIYIQNYWNYLLRLSILHAVARKNPQPSGEIGWIIEVEELDVDKADAFLRLTIDRAKEAIALSSTPIVNKPLVTEEGTLSVIYSIITSYGKEGISTSELLRKLRMLKDDLKKYIINLMEEGKIIATRRKVRRGRPPIKFYDAKYKNLIPAKEEVIDPRYLETIW